jgi:hypothetical protein
MVSPIYEARGRRSLDDRENVRTDEARRIRPLAL